MNFVQSAVFLMIFLFGTPIYASIDELDDDFFATEIESEDDVIKPVEKINQLSQESFSNEYLIGNHDLLEIEVFRVEDLTRTVRVNSGGEISLPLVGKIQAAGLTSQNLEARIAERLEVDLLQNAHVSVFIKEYSSQRITVEGAVTSPGMYPLTGKTTLLQSIALAAGLTSMADAEAVQLFRKNKSGEAVVYQIDVDAIRHGEALDPQIKGNDIIVVHKAPVRNFLKSFVDTIRGFISFGQYELFN